MSVISRQNTVISTKNHTIDNFAKSIIDSKSSQEPNDATFANTWLEYGNIWSRKVKNDILALPSPEEMLIGLYEWLCEQLRESKKHLEKNDQKKAINTQFKNFREMIEQIKTAIQIKNANSPMVIPKLESTKFDQDLDITNPYGKVTSLILYLYSMEIGTPPLYSEVNRVTRDMDLKYL